MLIQMINPAQPNPARATTASAGGASTATDFCKSNGFGSSASSSTHHHHLKSISNTGFGGTGGALGMKT